MQGEDPDTITTVDPRGTVVRCGGSVAMNWHEVLSPLARYSWTSVRHSVPPHC